MDINESELISILKSDKKIDDIADSLGISYGQVRYLRKKHGISKRRRLSNPKKINPKKKYLADNKYDTSHVDIGNFKIDYYRLSIIDLCYKYSLTKNHVYFIVKKHGITLKSKILTEYEKNIDSDLSVHSKKEIEYLYYNNDFKTFLKKIRRNGKTALNIIDSLGIERKKDKITRKSQENKIRSVLLSIDSKDQRLSMIQKIMVELELI